MGIETILIMIPKGGKYAKSVVNFVHKSVKNWPEFKSEIKMVLNLLKGKKLKLDGKQKTIFESNKNILKNHEKVTKKIEVPPSVKKEFPPFNISKTDPFKGWTPTLVERSQARNIYKDLSPPKAKYTKEMEAIDEELDALAFGGDKYAHLSVTEKNKIMKTLQAEMKQLIAKGEDLSTLSLGQINKRTQNIQKRIKDIADNPNIKGTVNKGPKRDMIEAIADSERKGLEDARDIIKLKNAKKKYGDKFPRLDPDNDAFIITGLTESGNPMRVGRFTGRFSAERHPITAELTRKEGTSYWDMWDAKKNQIRKQGEEVWHETLDSEGKVIMSNPDYKVTTKNMEIWNELYNETSISDLAKKGHSLKNLDMLVKGRAVNKYLEANKVQTDSTKISDIMEDLYFRNDDVYRMSKEEWTKKIPEYFVGGGRAGFHQGSTRHQLTHDYKAYSKPSDYLKWAPPSLQISPEVWNPERDAMQTTMKERFMYGEPTQKKEDSSTSEMDQTVTAWIKEQFLKLVGKTDGTEGLATGGISNLFQERQGYRSGELITKGIKLVKGARWLIKQLKSVLDDMIYGSGDVKSIFSKMPEAEKVKMFKQTESAIKSLESGGPIPDEILTSLRNDARFKGLTVSKTADKDFREMNEVVLGKLPKGTGEIIEGAAEQIQNLKSAPVVDEKVELFAFMGELPKELQDKVALLPIDQQLPLLRKFKEAFDAVKTGGVEGGIDVLQKELLEGFIPKGKPHATGGLIDGYATGGVSNLFRQRQGFRTGNIAKLPEFIKFVEGLLMKASNEIRRGLGKWKGLADKQKWAQHDNLTKIVTEFMRTKKFDPKMNEYFGIDAEKAFIEAQAKVAPKKTRTIDDEIAFRQTEGKKWLEEKTTKAKKIPLSHQENKILDAAYEDVGHHLKLEDLKYEADVLAESYASQLGKVYDDLPNAERSELYGQAYNRLTSNLKMKMDLKKMDQKIILSEFDVTGKKGNAAGGLIGYATGGVSNLFRSR